MAPCLCDPLFNYIQKAVFLFLLLKRYSEHHLLLFSLHPFQCPFANGLLHAKHSIYKDKGDAVPFFKKGKKHAKQKMMTEDTMKEIS